MDKTSFFGMRPAPAAAAQGALIGCVRRAMSERHDICRRDSSHGQELDAMGCPQADA